MISLFIQRDMERLLRKKNFTVLEGFALHTPENYPPMIIGGMAMDDSPGPKELMDFKGFVERLASRLKEAEKGRPMKSVKLGNPWLGWIPAPSRRMSKNSMGFQLVDTSLCIQCRTCEHSCPYQAITLQPFPMFDHIKCFGCWACFNRCPRQAIYTTKIRGQGHYPKPLPQLLEKLLNL
ncbi:MAG: 4Fe-4S binding protein [Syntrophaceae bacterium]|nr:4Fe-4S binding protein [Syntrophaceae bacterium]